MSLRGLLPGLLLVGAGMGLCITPLVTTVLATVEPESAGATSGLLLAGLALAPAALRVG